MNFKTVTTDRKYIIFTAFTALCAIGAVFSFILGQASIPFAEVIKFITGGEGLDTRYSAILKMRLARMLVAFIAGGGLAFAGVIYQSALKNYLADPFMLGVSAGAALFSALAISFKIQSSVMISLFAFFGALISVGFVILLSGFKKFSNYNLILSGIALNSFFSSFLTIVMYLSKDMQNIFFWLMGSLDVKYNEQIIYTYVLVIAACIYAYANSHILDILKLNEKTVFSMGIDEMAWKIKFIVLSSVVSALIVSQTGIIGFVGLIMPHAGRILIGDLHRNLIPFSFLLGGTMMIYCDLISRTVIDSMNFPIGVITSAVGAPFFIMLLTRAGKRGEN